MGTENIRGVENEVQCRKEEHLPYYIKKIINEPNNTTTLQKKWNSKF